MHTLHGFRGFTIALVTLVFFELLFSTDFLITPASARYYCDDWWAHPAPDPDELVWLPWRTYCERFQPAIPFPSWFMVDDYPVEDLPNCKELGTAWFIETTGIPEECESVVPTSGYTTSVSYELPFACNGNPPPPIEDYYISARIEHYQQYFDIICPGYPTQNILGTVATKYFVREPVGPDEPIEEKNRGNPACGLSAGNPINIATGNKFHAQVDAQLPDGLSISRYYNSSDTETHSFGRNWRGSFSRHLDIIFSGDQSESSVTLVNDDGAENYWQMENGIPKAPPDATSKLEVAYDNGQVLGFTLVTKSGSIETYGPSGQLLSILSDNGQALYFAYSDYRLASVTANSGRALNYTYQPDGKVDQILSSDGSTWKYFYDANNNLSQVEFPDGSVKTYHYEDLLLPHALTGVTDENGNRIRSWAYDDLGRAVLSTYGDTQSPVERHTINYNADGTTSTSDPMQLSADHSFKARHGTYKFDTSSHACSGCGNSTKNTAYDERGNRDLVTDFAGNTTDYDYTTENLVQKVTYAVGTAQQHEVYYSWDENLRKPTRISTEDTTIQYTYNSRGQVLSKVLTDIASGAIRAWTYSYFEAPAALPLVGKLQSLDGPRTDVSDITLYEYYASDHVSGNYRLGDLRAVINPSGHRTEYLKYDGKGQLLESTDPNGVTTSMAYSPRGWVLSTTTDGNVTRFSYDNVGNLTGYTLPDGSHTSYHYDDYHRLTAIEDSLGNRIEYELDGAGNRTSERTVDELGNLRHQLGRVYNSLNQLAVVLDGSGGETRYEYDANGNPLAVIDANLNITRYEYDALKRLVSIIDPILGETRFAHDSGDNPTLITDPMGNSTQYVYDGLDNHVVLDSPDTGLSQHEYDDAGNRIATTDARGVTTAFAYDALNRLLQVSYPDSTLDVNYGYDEGPWGTGRLTSMSDAAGTVQYEYDRRGNLTREIRVISEKEFITSFAYSASDRLVQVTYPSGMVIHYQLDAMGQPTSITKSNGSSTETLVDNINHAPFGPVTSFTYGNGSGYSATLNLNYEPEQLQSGPGLDWTLGHDALGNVVAITDHVDAQHSQDFQYDDIYRLVSAQGEYGSELFAYDANGNRTGLDSELTSEVYSYEPQSNRLATQGDWAFTRDASGNRIGKLNAQGMGQLFEFGDHGRLAQASNLNGSGTDPVGIYTYNGRGQRVIKSVNGEIMHFIYGLSGELLGEYSDQANGTSREYVYLNAQPIAVITRKAELSNPQGKELILDNDDPETSRTGSWRRKTDNAGYGGDYLFAGKSTNRSYRWTASAPGSQYQVYAWWVDKKKYSDSVDYTIRYGTGEFETVTRSHRTGGGQWQLLGTYHSADGQDFVEVTSPNNKFVADAIRWVEITEPVITEVETTHFIHFDHLGTPRKVTDPNQTVIWSWDSTPFGQSDPDQDPDQDLEDFVLNLRFPGQYYDAESSLHYNYFRTYDPATGRYIESDPIGLNGGLNTFSYVAGSPVNLTDALGLVVSGDWISAPKFNITDYGLNGFRGIAPYLDQWGFLKTVGVSGYVNGYINLDIKCNDSEGCESNEWEVHVQLPVSYNGTKDFGPNMLAAGVGNIAGPLAGAATWILTFGGSTLTALLDLLREAEAHGGNQVQRLYALGPDAICRGFQ